MVVAGAGGRVVRHVGHCGPLADAPTTASALRGAKEGVGRYCCWGAWQWSRVVAVDSALSAQHFARTRVQLSEYATRGAPAGKSRGGGRAEDPVIGGQSRLAGLAEQGRGEQESTANGRRKHIFRYPMDGLFRC